MAEEALQRIVRERLDKAERFLRTAQGAFSDGDYDSCVSRAYYAVFHGILALGLRSLVNNEEGLTGSESHPYVISWCDRWNHRHTRLNIAGFLDRGHRSLNQSLEGLYRWRREADYHVEMVDKQRAQNALNFARRMLMAIKEVVS